MKDYKYKYLYYVLTEPSSITNGLPGIYFGQHQTNDLNDGYIGSGKLLNVYLKKHPNEFERHIVGFYDTKDELNKAEYDAIHDILHMPICLNLKEGGCGGGGKWSDESKLKLSKTIQGHPGYTKGKTPWNKGLHIPNIKWKGQHHSEETKQKMHEARKNFYENGGIHPMLGKKHSEETKKHWSEIRKGSIPWNKGKKGSQKAWNKGKHKVWDDKDKNIYHYE